MRIDRKKLENIWLITIMTLSVIAIIGHIIYFVYIGIYYHNMKNYLVVYKLKWNFLFSRLFQGLNEFNYHKLEH